ncbi:MAG: holo-[acyl-carrier-protein] synthase [Nitrospiraceae bacterium]|jgi:holo-[acyl-carrier protein] synthase|nr:holo-[acyl-carrier-protein] synthase [Nitrospiraceae bacterium]|tara:strand:+ start:475 stop:867 length:393 start_codon:yes stop_codon:yes gene_type:complete
MIIGIGIDLVRIDRLQAIATRWEDRFLARVYTCAERDECFARATPFPALAGRFALKEAMFKALGTGWNSGISWVEVEVFTDGTGKPMIRTSGKVHELLDSKKASTIHVTASHDGDYAIGQVILTKDDCEK